MLKKIFAVAILASFTSLCAHGLIVQKNGANKFDVKFGHLPDKFMEFNPKQLLNAMSFDENGNLSKRG